MMPALALCALVGCQRPEALVLHYEPAPTTAHLSFFPAKIAIVPPTMSSAKPDLMVGTAYDAGGYVKAKFVLDDASRQIADVISHALEHAGLKPVAVTGPPPGNMPPFGVDFMLTSEVTKFQCVKRLLAGTVGLQEHFVMNADVGLHFTLRGRGGVLYDGSTFYVAHEPRERTDTATHQPQVTDPAHALSIALSRATEVLLTQPAVRNALPRRTTMSLPSPQTSVINATSVAVTNGSIRADTRQPNSGVRAH